MLQENLPYYPEPREHPFHPSKIFATYRKEEPVVKARLWNGNSVWLATRYDDVRRVLTEYETFSQVPGPGYPTACPGRHDTVMEEVPTFVRMDPPRHTVQRRAVLGDFTMKSVSALRPRMTEIVDGLLNRMEEKGFPADLSTDFAQPLPTTIITEYLGLPLKDHAFIHQKSAEKLNLEVDGKVARQAQLDLLAYLERELLKKADQPEADDIMARLLRNQVQTGEMSLGEAVGTIELLVTAGHETTANMIALGTLVLLQYPEEMEKLRNDRSLMGGAINELLRFLTINQNVGGRLCVKDTELGGKQIRAGEGVFALLQSADRDETVFADPDKFDITRSPNNHVAFGFGVHQCLGLSLAKMEMDVAFNRLLDRFPNLKLAVPFEDLSFKHEAVVFGVRSLPVTW
ncbi:cytochrome P450 [Paracoccus pantotrophus]|uniref:cytochrome P450 n=1 Tax=Paracoccus pantotrophus TaxID=82367 RepID=UPI00048F8A72|nr:cytochrome P450 [Paracoccus pantotrophus]